jgi:sugar lactone lactonase YvrE
LQELRYHWSGGRGNLLARPAMDEDGEPIDSRVNLHGIAPEGSLYFTDSGNNNLLDPSAASRLPRERSWARTGLDPAEVAQM